MQETNHPVALRFPALLDWWVAAFVVFLLAMMVASIPLVLAKVLYLPGAILLAAVLIASFLILVDKAFFASYILAPEGLFVNTQFHSLFIPYDSIQGVKNGSVLDLFSRGSMKRFALSSNSLVLHVSDQQWKRISISPMHKQDFLSLLLGHLELVQGDRKAFIQKAPLKKKCKK